MQSLAERVADEITSLSSDPFKADALVFRVLDGRRFQCWINDDSGEPTLVALSLNGKLVNIYRPGDVEAERMPVTSPSGIARRIKGLGPWD